MVFCFKNCSDLVWEKFVPVTEKNIQKFESEGREFANFWRSLDWNSDLFDVKKMLIFLMPRIDRQPKTSVGQYSLRAYINTDRNILVNL